MKRATLNFAVDAAIGAAFVTAAISGIVFLLPMGWVHVSASGTPTILGLGTALWHTIHQDSSLAVIAGVALHVLLHGRWIGMMVRRVKPRRSSIRSDNAGRMRPGAATPAPSTPESRPGYRAAPALSRKAFLAGVGSVVAAAVLGVSLAVRDAGGTSVEGRRGGGLSGARRSERQSDAADQTYTARVMVDDTVCMGCGSCHAVCPAGVFGMDADGRAVAQSPGSCRLCGRCLQVCMPAAITLNT